MMGGLCLSMHLIYGYQQEFWKIWLGKGKQILEISLRSRFIIPTILCTSKHVPLLQQSRLFDQERLLSGQLVLVEPYIQVVLNSV